jgi:tetratricopeptide (TPR) repeat protein
MVGTAGLLLAACSNPNKMIEAASQVQAKCEPAVLEARANVIDARYTLTFPAKYFHEKAVLELIPVLVYAGGEEVGPSKWLQGEKVTDNYTVIPKTGGNATQSVQFNYKEGMQAAQLDLRVKLHYKGKASDYPVPFKLADGTIITYKLAETDGVAILAPDAYQKVYTETREAQIKYSINSATVRPSELSKTDIKELEAFLAEANTDAKKQAKGTEIVAYASPDGPLPLNENLSTDRGQTAKTALAKVTKKIQAQGPVNVSTIAEDWEGFRELVSSSSVQDKDLILRVLSMYNDPIVREREIKNMAKVYEILADKVLPELRRARVVARVDVHNYSDQELQEMVRQNNVEALDVEALLYAATLLSDNAAKINVYNKAAQKFNDWRAYNNMAYVYLQESNVAEAKAALAKIKETNDIVSNNNGVVALREGRLDEAAKLFTAASATAPARENLGTVAIFNGNYPDAVGKLANTGSFNEALAAVLVKDYSKATNILKNLDSAKAFYLKAVVAARNGNVSQVASELQNAYAKDPALKDYARTDIEFAKVKDSI